MTEKGPPNDFFHKMVGTGSVPSDEASLVLKHYFERAAAPCPFARGDLMSARSDAPINVTGPQLLLDILHEPVLAETVAGIMGMGYVMNVRVAHVCGAGHVHLYLAQHEWFDPYFVPPILGQPK